MSKKAWVITGVVCTAILGAWGWNEYCYYKSAPYLVLRKVETSYPKAAFTASYKVESMGKTWSMHIESDGHGHVRQQENDPDQRAEQIALFDFPAKKIYWLQTQDKVAVEHPMDGSGLGYADENMFTYDGKKLGSKTIAGEASHGWKRELAGQPMQSWFSDRIGCLVECDVFGKHVILQELKPGAPPEQQFQVPAGYQVKPLT
jgi:hypothetical protein